MEAQIKIASIKFPFSESNEINTSVVYTSFTAANAAIARAVAMCKVTDNYFKTDFVLTYTDGFTYKGRIDIDGDGITLAEHVTNTQKHVLDPLNAPFYTALHRSKPERFAELVKFAVDFLAKYSLADA